MKIFPFTTSLPKPGWNSSPSKPCAVLFKRFDFSNRFVNRHRKQAILLEADAPLAQIIFVRAHGMWTYEPRQGRKAATVVCSVSAVVTLTLFNLRLAIFDIRLPSQLQTTR